MSEAVTTYVCPKHGAHKDEVCLSCFAIQQERVERESLALRLTETTESQRRWVVEELSKRNGGNGHH